LKESIRSFNRANAARIFAPCWRGELRVNAGCSVDQLGLSSGGFMRNFVWPRILFCLFFLSGLLLALSCRVGTEPESAPDDKKVVQVAKEDHGFNLMLDNAVVQSPGPFVFYFRVRRSFASELLGNYADPLTCANFTLLENDELISGSESDFSVKPAYDDYKMFAVLLLDMSGSVAPAFLDTLKTAAKRFVSNLFRASDNFQKSPLQIELSIYYFDGRAGIFQLVPFTADSAQLKKAIDDSISANLTKDNSTNLYGAVIHGIDVMRNLAGKKNNLISAGSLVIFTDGTDRAGRRTKADAIRVVEDTTFAFNKLISTYTIGLGEEIDKATLIRLAKDGSVFADGVDKLVPGFESIANRILIDARSPYQIEYCSPLRVGTVQLFVRAHTINHLYYGSVTMSFPANDAGGCTVTGSCLK
jgi:hypothetical protein